MTPISEVRDALADVLKVALEMRYASGRWQSVVQPLGVYILPQGGTDYVTFDGGTFCQWTLSLSAIIIGPTADPAKSMAWLDAAIQLAPPALDADPTLGGRVSNVVLAAVTEPGLVTIEGSGSFLSVELRFRPFFITP